MPKRLCIGLVDGRVTRLSRPAGKAVGAPPSRGVRFAHVVLEEHSKKGQFAALSLDGASFRVAVLVLIGVMAPLGCAGGPPREAGLDRLFACIQVQEARIERERAMVASADSRCEEVCAAATQARVSEARLCRLAQTAADADALARCQRAQETTFGIGAQAGSRCACSL